VDPIVGPLLIAAAAVAVAVWARGDHAASEVWARLAAQHGRPPPGRRMQMDIELAGVCVRIRENEQGQTSVRARYLLGAGPRFEVRARGLATDLDLRFGLAATDLVLGDTDFDDRFVVHGDSVEDVLRAWNGKARVLRERLPVVVVCSDGVYVELIHNGLIRDIATLDGALRLVAELAGTDGEAFAALASLPDAVIHLPAGDFDTRTLPRVELPALRVTLTPALATGKRVTLVQTALPRSVARFELALRPDGAPAGTPPAGLDWNGAAPFLAEVAPARLAGGDGLLRLWFSEWIVDPRRLLAAARLCQALARPERR
jgi:hypothetical protein